MIRAILHHSVMVYQLVQIKYVSAKIQLAKSILIVALITTAQVINALKQYEIKHA